jgi:hypothetical protein
MFLIFIIHIRDIRLVSIHITLVSEMAQMVRGWRERGDPDREGAPGRSPVTRWLSHRSENHTIPILTLGVLSFGKLQFVIFPLVGTHRCRPWFNRVAEAVDCIGQTLEVRDTRCMTRQDNEFCGLNGLHAPEPHRSSSKST